MRLPHEQPSPHIPPLGELFGKVERTFLLRLARASPTLRFLASSVDAPDVFGRRQRPLNANLYPPGELDDCEKLS